MSYMERRQLLEGAMKRTRYECFAWLHCLHGGQQGRENPSIALSDWGYFQGLFFFVREEARPSSHSDEEFATLRPLAEKYVKDGSMAVEVLALFDRPLSC